MRKVQKTVFIISLTGVLLGGYQIYFTQIHPRLVSEMSHYTNVTYVVDNNYKITAKTQQSSLSEVLFTVVTALMDGNVIQSPTATLNRFSNALEMSGGVSGSSNNGWLFKTETLHYDSRQKMISSQEITNFKNPTVNETLTGGGFQSDSGFIHINLFNHCIFETPHYKLISNTMSYDKQTGIVEANGEVHFQGENVLMNGKVIKKITVECASVTLQKYEKIIIIDTPFVANVDGMVIQGNHLFYNEATGDGTIEGSVVIKQGPMTIYGDKLTLEGKSNLFTLTGDVHGQSDSAKFTADQLTLKKEELLLTAQNISIVRTDGLTIRATQSITNLKTNDTQFLSDENSSVVATIGKNEIIANEIDTNSSSGNIYIPNNFKFQFYNKNKLWKGSAEELTLDEKTGNGECINFKGSSGSESTLCDTFTFNQKQHTFNFLGNVLFFTALYQLTGTQVNSNSDTNITEVVGDFTLLNNLTRNRLNSTHLVFNQNTNQIDVDEPFTYSTKKMNLSGDELHYNIRSGDGVISGDISYNNPGSKESATTDQPVTITQGNFVKIPGNIYMLNGNSTITTSNIEFDIKKNTGIIHGAGVITDSGRMYDIHFQNGVIDSNNEFITMNQVAGVLSPQGDNPVNFNTQSADYYYNLDNCVYNTPMTYTMQNYQLVLAKGSLDFSANLLKGESPQLTSQQGDHITSKQLLGNINTMEFEFNGDVDGNVHQVDSKTLSTTDSTMQFTADNAELYLQGTSYGRFITRRFELRNHCILNYDVNSKLTADYIEFNALTKLIFSKGNASFKTTKENMISGKADSIQIAGTAEIIDSNLIDNVLNFSYHVVINTLTKAAGKVVVTSDKATMNLNENTLTLTKDATVTRGNNVIKAQKAIFDMKTNDLYGKENIDMSVDMPIN